MNDPFENGRGSKNKPADIVRVTIHGWNGELIDKAKARATEKNKGALIIDRLRDIFNVNEEDIAMAKLIDVENESNGIHNPEQDNDKPKPFSNDWRTKPIQWKRDSRGNIA